MNSSKSQVCDRDNSSTMMQLHLLWRTARTTGAASASKRSNASSQSMINHDGLRKARKKRKRPVNTRSSIVATNAKTSRINSGNLQDAREVVPIIPTMEAATPPVENSSYAHNIQTPTIRTSPRGIERKSEGNTFCEMSASDKIYHGSATKDEMMRKSTDVDDGFHSNQSSTVESAGLHNASTITPPTSGFRGRYRDAKSLALFSISASNKSQQYSHSTVDYLNKWFDEHHANPFPTSDEKLNLMATTGLNKIQLDGWLRRARKKRNQMANSSIRSTTVTNVKDAPTINQSCIPAHGTSLAKIQSAGTGGSFRPAKDDTNDMISSEKFAELSENPLANWVQCDNPSCLKWRKLPEHVRMDRLPEQFFCKDNIWTDIKMSCNVPEDEWDTMDVTVKCDTNIVQVYHTGGK